MRNLSSHIFEYSLFLLILSFTLLIVNGFECSTDEEVPIGSKLIDTSNGKSCNILTMKAINIKSHRLSPSSAAAPSSFSSSISASLKRSTDNIVIKLLPSRTNQISSYFQIVTGTASSSSGDYSYLSKYNRYSTDNNRNTRIEIGDILTKKELDREKLCYEVGECCNTDEFCWFTLQILIREKSTNLASDSLSKWPMNIEAVRIKLIDINDNAPTFSQLVKVIDISEISPVGTKTLLPLAKDPDSKVNNILVHKLEGEDYQTFQLVQDWTPQDGSVSQIYLKLLSPLDRENVSSYLLNLIAIDKGKPPKQGKLALEIKVTDANDNRPIFENSSYVLGVSECENVGYLITRIRAQDRDEGRNGQINYSLSADLNNADIKRKFHIDSVTGWLSLSEPLDYEKVKKYKLTVVAHDNPISNPLYSKVNVMINIKDCNDNAPVILLERSTETGNQVIKEGSITGPREYALVFVSDLDSGKGGQFKCMLKGSKKFELIQMNLVEVNTLRINLISELDHEERPVERFKIICYDLAEPRRTSSVDEEVIVQDINDNSPIFDQVPYSGFIEENNRPQQLIMKVKASDKDSGLNGKIRYEIRSNYDSLFSIEESTGIIRALIKFDREKQERYTFLVIAVDCGTPIKSASVNVMVRIKDENDNTPKFHGMNHDNTYAFQIEENKAPGTMVGTVFAEDPDEGKNGDIEYSLLTHSAWFSIEPNSGMIRSIKTLDREVTAAFNLFVQASDRGTQKRLKSQISVSVTVSDVNDNKPTVQFPTQNNNTISVSFHDEPGSLIAQIEATDKDEGNNAVLDYQVIGHGKSNQLFKVHSGGKIYINRQLTKSDMGEYYLQILISDQGIPALSVTVNFLVTVDNDIRRANKYNYNSHGYYKKDYDSLVNSKSSYNVNGKNHQRGSKEDELSTSVILVVSIALICIIALVMLSLAVFLCGKHGQDAFGEVFFNKADNRAVGCDSSVALHAASSPGATAAVAGSAADGEYGMRRERSRTRLMNIIRCFCFWQRRSRADGSGLGYLRSHKRPNSPGMDNCGYKRRYDGLTVSGSGAGSSGVSSSYLPHDIVFNNSAALLNRNPNEGDVTDRHEYSDQTGPIIGTPNQQMNYIRFEKSADNNPDSKYISFIPSYNGRPFDHYTMCSYGNTPKFPKIMQRIENIHEKSPPTNQHQLTGRESSVLYVRCHNNPAHVTPDTPVPVVVSGSAKLVTSNISSNNNNCNTTNNIINSNNNTNNNNNNNIKIVSQSGSQPGPSNSTPPGIISGINVASTITGTGTTSGSVTINGKTKSNNNNNNNNTTNKNTTSSSSKSNNNNNNAVVTKLGTTVRIHHNYTLPSSFYCSKDDMYNRSPSGGNSHHNRRRQLQFPAIRTPGSSSKTDGCKRNSRHIRFPSVPDSLNYLSSNQSSASADGVPRSTDRYFIAAVTLSNNIDNDENNSSSVTSRGSFV